MSDRERTTSPNARTLRIIAISFAVLGFFYFVMPSIWEAFVTWFIEGRS